MDICSMVIAFIAALAIAHKVPFSFYLVRYYLFGLIILIITAFSVFIILDVYSPHKLQTRLLNKLMLIGVALLFSSVVTTMFFFFFRNPVPRGVFIVFYLFSWLLLSLSRSLQSRLNTLRILHKILLVGEPAICSYVSKLISQRTYLNSQVIGYLSDVVFTQPIDIQYYGTIDSLTKILINHQFDQIITTTDNIHSDLMKDLMKAMKYRISVNDYKQVIETITGQIPIDYLNANWFINELASIDKRYTWFFKRNFDIVTVLCGGIIAIPIILIASIIIKLSSRGPVFYSQIRIGRGMRRFRVWKLRTMVIDADKNGDFWTSENDKRITRGGRFLRRFRIDELPQLWNILKGEMSLIGPRPEAESLVTLYKKEIPYYAERHMVTPGVTGWAQINYPYGNSIEDTREKLKFDFYYIKNRGVLLDVLIFLKTIKIVLTGKGAL